MEVIIEYWPHIVATLAVIAAIGYAVYTFIKRPTDEQMNKVKEWLLFAVSQSEKELGSGTGQIKLRYVYDMFLGKFPYLAKIIPFELFSNLVDESLEKFRAMLTDNKAVKDYVSSSPIKVSLEAAQPADVNFTEVK